MNSISSSDKNKFVFSLEIFPPKRGGSINAIYDTLSGLECIKPDFISVTYGAGGNPADTSTCEIADIIKNKYNITPVAHLTCVNSDKNQVDDTLDFLKSRGVNNILALRGDIAPEIERKNDFKYASDLVKYISKKGGFNISGACYPECHSECESLEKDIENLKYKIDAGVTHLISQLFFDNDSFYRFIEKVRGAGITVPIEAGIMPITNTKQIERMVLMCGASIPQKLSKILSKYENYPEALRDACISYACSQIVDLAANEIDGIHLYTMNKPEIATKIYKNIETIRTAENN